MESRETITVDDRYGGNPPSWLRGCHGGCEAMGFVPVYVREADTRPDDPRLGAGRSETKPGLLKAWYAKHAEQHEEPCDGWHFVHCADCDGTGRVSWLVTVTRLPRWVVRGVRLLFDSPTMGPKRTWRDVVLAFKCTFLADLGLWRP